MPIDIAEEKKKLSRKAMAESKRIGREMTLKRKAKGLKASWVAAQMNIHPTQLCSLEKGTRYWRDYHVKAYLAAIGETNNKKVNK